MLKGPQLKLLPCTQEWLKAILGEDDALLKQFGIIHDRAVISLDLTYFQIIYEKINSHPNQVTWWAYLAVLNETNTLIGDGGYKGPPDEKGTVEIGYSVYEPFRGKGYAKEMALLLTNNALSDPKVQLVQAHTQVGKNASTSVLKYCGFEKVNVHPPLVFGTLWRWEIRSESD